MRLRAARRPIRDRKRQTCPAEGDCRLGGYESAMAQQKADMQRQYAAQLQQDQAANKRQETPDMPGGGVGPGLQIGGYESAMAQQKADMQRQYAAQLQQDQAANQDMNRSQSLPGGGGLQVGGYESAMAQQKADMQRQYAAQLQQDQAANKRQETPDMPGGGVGPGLQIGGYESAMAQQRPICRGSMRLSCSRTRPIRDRKRQTCQEVVLGLLQIGGYESAMAQQKADMQRQYAAQLQQDQAANKRQETPDMPGGGVGPGLSDWRLRECDGSAKGRYAEAVCGSAAAGPGQ